MANLILVVVVVVGKVDIIIVVVTISLVPVLYGSSVVRFVQKTGNLNVLSLLAHVPPDL